MCICIRFSAIAEVKQSAHLQQLRRLPVNGGCWLTLTRCVKPLWCYLRAKGKQRYEGMEFKRRPKETDRADERKNKSREKVNLLALLRIIKESDHWWSLTICRQNLAENASYLLCLFWSVKGTITSLFSYRWNLESGWWLRKIQSFHCYLEEGWGFSCPWRHKGDWVHLDKSEWVLSCSSRVAGCLFQIFLD